MWEPLIQRRPFPEVTLRTAEQPTLEGGSSWLSADISPADAKPSVRYTCPRQKLNSSDVCRLVLGTHRIEGVRLDRF
jgi:hypothetical protein